MQKSQMENKKDPQTYAILGAAFEVHKQLGSGFLETVYQAALARELTLCQIPFVREVELPVLYKGEPLNCSYRADFICYGDVIVEIKAIAFLGKVEEAQVLNYLKATSLQRALLLNFGASSLQYKRLVHRYEP